MRAHWLSCATAALVAGGHATTEAFGGISTNVLGAQVYHHLKFPYLSPGTTLPKVGAFAMAENRTKDGRCLFKTLESVGAEDFEGRMQTLARRLELELPRQYEKPQDLSIFADTVEFRDPVTNLRGKLKYRGMLICTLLFFRIACKPGSPYFTVTAIDRPTRETIRTVWETGAVTLTGRDLFISGVDYFTVGDDGLIARHDSAWDQTWEEVRGQIS